MPLKALCETAGIGSLCIAFPWVVFLGAYWLGKVQARRYDARWFSEEPWGDGGRLPDEYCSAHTPVDNS